MTKETVKQIQGLLHALGNSPGEIDGEWGRKSQAALDATCQEYGVGISKPETTTPDVADNNVGDFWKDIRHFTREEFRCKCGGQYCNGYPAEMKEKLLRVADAIRDELDAPAIVSSGLRCETWNRLRGGVYNSRHRTGCAMDFAVRGVSGAKLDAVVGKYHEVAYHYNISGTDYVHMDVVI